MFGVWVPQLLMPFSQWGRTDALSLLNCKIKQITMCPCEKFEISKFGFLCIHCSTLRGFSKQYIPPLYLKGRVVKEFYCCKILNSLTQHFFSNSPPPKKPQNQKKPKILSKKTPQKKFLWIQTKKVRNNPTSHTFILNYWFWERQFIAIGDILNWKNCYRGKGAGNIP